ncbi:anti-sigma F factor antagonist [Paenibacillus polysaccharolyticus]|uniref:Anti-sigma F factor antagonist n=3 Tax=Paenibacillus TaxID=44249 RepID=A0A5M9WLL9_PAEAM|nr:MULTISPECIES: anti-sigma F factor antagonist [Paenibacillus]MDP9699738.1 stage II sporulation protein AA (anti-sigma F factor antagonist) [Paenibacillus intestini]KAA8782255.1 anti-sigma F factor antagonist [Paenibacillus amylolyticus]MBY0203862.1 anti-sigma F factor antagonist [Paenibacillus cucumis (ex Kampfer et al. 2016)]MCM3136006.1 anti-sigma F factor antagonist [Paenibacillus polysaccharolyticus]MCP1133015.1 anti-sigma F factor antagonist [Paenibacillus polysaccharolyticus]
MNLNVDMEHHRGILIVRLSGELDHHTADMVRMQMDEAIQRRQCEHLVLSLKDLEFMDSSGLGVILGRYKLIKNKGGKMVVCDVNPPVYRLLEMSGLFKIMPIYENEGTALSGLEVVS